MTNIKRGDQGTESTFLEEEYNKQQENILKMFANISDRNSSSKESFALILFSFIPAVISLLFVILCMYFFKSSGQKLIDSVPHLITASSSYYCGLSMISNFHGVIHIDKGYNLRSTGSYSFMQSTKFWLEKAMDSYRALACGDLENDVLPYYHLLDYNSDFCETTRDSFHNMISCWRPTALVSWAQITSLGIIDRYLEEPSENMFEVITKDDPVLLLYHIQQFHLWADLYSKLFSSIIPDFELSLEENIPFSVPITLILCVLILVSESILIVVLLKYEKDVKYGLNLLLHCPMSNIFVSTHISNALSGNFLKKQNLRSNRDNQFYEKLVDDLPDSVITLNADGMIKYLNKAVERILELSSEDLLNQHISILS
jgi:PAS domain-containing protein